MKQERILVVCIFSTGCCGVFQRAKRDAIVFSEEKEGKNIVKIFSSNAIKGKDELAEDSEIIKDVEIKRFPFIKLGGESFMYFTGKKFKEAVREFKPTIIIAHCYRHIHTHTCLKLAKELKAKSVIFSHGSFKRDVRPRFDKIVVWFYDKIFGKKILKEYGKIVTIVPWEKEQLEKFLGIYKAPKMLYFETHDDYLKAIPELSKQWEKELTISKRGKNNE